MQAALNLVASNLVASVARGGLDAAPAGPGAAADDAASAEASLFALLAAAAMGEPVTPAGNGPASSPPACAPPGGLALHLIAGAPSKPADGPSAAKEFANAVAAWIGERPSPAAQDGAEAGAPAEGFATAVAAWIGERPSPAAGEDDGDAAAEAGFIPDPTGAAPDAAALSARVAAGADAPSPAAPVLDPAASVSAVLPAQASPDMAAGAPAAAIQAVGAADAGLRQAASPPAAPIAAGPVGPVGAEAAPAAAPEAGAARGPEQEGAALQAHAGEAQPDRRASAEAPAAAARAAFEANEPADASRGRAPAAAAIPEPGPTAEKPQRDMPARLAAAELPALEPARPESHWSVPSGPQGPVPHGPAAAPPLHAAAHDQAVPVVQNVPVSAVAVEIGVKSLAGVNRFEIRLDPPELGRVEVRLEIGEEGAVQARLVVDRVETLALLQREARTLERAFEQAGLKPSEGGIDLSLRDPQADARGQQRGDERGHRGEPQQAERPRAGSDAGEAPAPQPIRTVWRLAGGVDRRV